jgi:hypothetical protein
MKWGAEASKIFFGMSDEEVPTNATRMAGATESLANH